MSADCQREHTHAKGNKLQSGKQICIRAKGTALLYLLSMQYLFFLIKIYRFSGFDQEQEQLLKKNVVW